MPFRTAYHSPLSCRRGSGLLNKLQQIAVDLLGIAPHLVTANFKDFLTRGAGVLVPDRLARFAHPKGQLLIAHPFTVRSWFLTGRIELPSVH
jgi:hypothetical protein